MPLAIPPWPPQTPEIATALMQCMQNGDWGRYESQSKATLLASLQKKFEIEHVRLCCSGTAAIELSLRVAGVGDGDEVILCALDYPGNLRCVELIGAKPVLVDVAPSNFGPDLESVTKASSKQVRAVIASHLYGRACDIGALRDLCDANDWVLIEDVCQSPGMTIDGRAAGTFGHLATLSFGGSKPLSSGNGGAILATDNRLAARLGGLLDRPSDAFPLSALQASVLVPQIARLQTDNEHRNRIAKQIQQQLEKRDASLQCICETNIAVDPAYYKLALQTESVAIRDAMVAAATQHDLPLGKSFRAMSRLSDRRCRKPVPLDRAQMLADQICVLDHRALLIDEADVGELCELLLESSRGCGR
ncbi:UDP-2-acetamido-2-deoxy-3-oxo-D-glucuronate aminotransferase [Novipirellula galeiformis]|uniref:UDP-2-acetamido-2-deoxy-3-oxo-D-glucuronate aminotransferase n=1 Tax=Novipirellula galeiformis TaxID=2528004 RepID=A0A5C6CFK3_9BACT|nr:aminotransferase class I/II-fold pyridoxal phosphate-dependent enzyme [Novipirellula galeiformis]TWU23078.1 UDP-2-acetamido-2-deoxy-3-oxo-D-glucuronate aminotransferase [Novipirellula galeiformis]